LFDETLASENGSLSLTEPNEGKSMAESDLVNGNAGSAAPASSSGEAQIHKSMDIAMRAQRAELSRMISELKHLQESIRGQRQEEQEHVQRENQQLRLILNQQDQQVAEMQQENTQLRQMLVELEQEKAAIAAEAAKAAKGSPILEALIEEMKGEIAALRAQHDEKDSAMAKLKEEMYSLPPDMDADSLEAELIRFRHSLEADRRSLAHEIDLLREKNGELEEARREMELELSRERAELSRERTHLERMREEVRQDMERIQRDSGVREALAPVHQLRDQMVNRKPPQPPGARPSSLPSIPVPPSVTSGDSGLMKRLRGLRKGLNQ
jgi:chromosome segregation ATPase